MNPQDPENERKRLSEFYSSKSDGELEQLAEDLQSLTPQAQQILQEEIGRRHIEAAPELPGSAESEAEFRDLVTIRQFRDRPEALLAKGMLESAGIETFLADDNIVRMDWFISNFIGGIKLKVRPSDAEAAIEVLEQPIPEEFNYEGDAEYEQPRCPKCNSLDIIFEDWNKGASLATAWIVAPIPISRKSWKCLSCGARWVDDADMKS